MDELCKTCWNDSCRNSGEIYRSSKLLFCKRKLDTEELEGYGYDEEEDDEDWD